MPIAAQNIPNISDAQVKAELQRRGLSPEDEDLIRAKLEERGFDLDNLDPSQVEELELALEEVIAEIQSEKASTGGDSNSSASVPTTTSPEGGAIDTIGVPSPSAGIPDNELEVELPVNADSAPPTLPSAAIYGQQIFRDKSIGIFLRSKDALPSDSYILDSGDKINISIWGIAQEDATYTINSAGYIKPSRMPRISLKGINFGKAKELLESRFSQYYRFRPEDFEVTITHSRTISVSIYGEVFAPGSYTIPATNTALNALVAAGGPSNIGSVRNIKLHRDGQPSRTIDVYEFMNDPAVRENFYLRSNDVIHVSIARRVINIGGAVRRPSRYELKGNEQLNQLIEFAGGLNDNAYLSNVEIKRFSGDEERLININLRELQENNQDFELSPGDEVMIRTIPKPFKNYVNITGAVAIPGKYELTENMRISDLIDRVELEESARKDIAILIRLLPDGKGDYEMINLNEVLKSRNSSIDLVLRPQDRLRILSQRDYADRATIKVEGAVRSPSEHVFGQDQDLRVSEAILLAGGLAKDATSFAYIHRTDPINARLKEYIRVDLDQALSNPESSANVRLKPADRLFIYSKLTYVDESFVNVSGAVRNPGEYQFDESLSLSDILTMAGGLKLEAASNRIDIFRIVVNEEEPTKTIVATVNLDEDFTVNGNQIQLEPFDQIIVREVPEFAYQKIVTINGAVRYPGPYALLDKNEKLNSIINRAGGLTSEAFLEGSTLYRAEEGIGYIILDLESAIANRNSKFNYILREGDLISIPKQKDIVTIRLNNTKSADLYPEKILAAGKFNVPFHEGKNAKFYLEKYAAGIGQNGKRALITVEHPNGEIERTKNWGIAKRYPKVKKGSIISVGSKKVKPEKEKAPKEEREKIDWSKTIADSLAQATAILSLILLVQQVSR